MLRRLFICRIGSIFQRHFIYKHAMGHMEIVPSCVWSRQEPAAGVIKLSELMQSCEGSAVDSNTKTDGQK